MFVEEQDYKLEILDYAVNRCIDNLLPSNSEDALSIILYQSNEVVWRVTTEIYTKSGHQIDFVFIRDILNLRIKPLQEKIAEDERIRREKEAEEARIKAKLEAERLKREIEEARIKTELEAQKLARKAEEERLRKERAAKEARIKAEQEKIRNERTAKEARIKRQREEEERKKLQEFKKANPDIEISTYNELKIYESEVFTKVKNIIVEQLEIELDLVTLNAVLSRDLGADNNFDWRNASYMNRCDDVEIMMAIEEEFDIEIPDEEVENLLSWNVCQLVDFVMQKVD